MSEQNVGKKAKVAKGGVGNGPEMELDAVTVKDIFASIKILDELAQFGGRTERVLTAIYLLSKNIIYLALTDFDGLTQWLETMTVDEFDDLELDIILTFHNLGSIMETLKVPPPPKWEKSLPAQLNFRKYKSADGNIPFLQEFMEHSYSGVLALHKELAQPKDHRVPAKCRTGQS